MASSASVTLTQVIGSKCDFPWECHTRVSRSYCSYRSVCECLYGFYYDKDSDSCYRPKNYGEKCDPSNILEGCRNEYLVCAEYGTCICHPGLHFDPAQIPFCQPNNSTKCVNGDIWDALRNRCVHFKPTWTEGNIYERNRYSLFFAIVLVLTVMIILFKSKWSSSNPFVVGNTTSHYSRRHGVRRSTHRGSRDSRISFPETTIIPDSRLSEYYGPVFRNLVLGRYPGCHVQCDYNENYNNCYTTTCRTEPEAGYNPHPPPPYSSTCNLATTGLSGSQFMIDKPPPYESEGDARQLDQSTVDHQSSTIQTTREGSPGDQTIINGTSGTVEVLEVAVAIGPSDPEIVSSERNDISREERS